MYYFECLKACLKCNLVCHSGQGFELEGIINYISILDMFEFILCLDEGNQ